MSLYGALITGVAGLNANSKALSVSSSNIANVNTVGYKTGQNSFSTVLASSLGSGDISSAGVLANTKQVVSQQGLLSSTSSATDLAISGNGFFVVSKDVGTSASSSGSGSGGGSASASNQSLLYTRAGSFTPDASGNLRNTSGLYLMGWQLDSAGNVPSDRNTMAPINVTSLSGKAEATTNMSLKANLQASTAAKSTYSAGDLTAGTTEADFKRTISVYDSQGGAQPLQVAFIKTGANTWSYEVTYQGDDANIGGAGANPLATGEMEFNTDGTLKTADTGAGSATGSFDVDIPWAAVSGLSAQTVSIKLGTPDASNGLTQFDNASSLTSSSVDGAPVGSVSGVSIDNNGYVTANFTNGLSQKVFKIPVASFTNPDGLSAVSGNAYTTSNESGTPTIGEANLGGAGTIQGQALEGSTVDLATEFTNLITTQRAYSASARIVTTASEMLQELMQMR